TQFAAAEGLEASLFGAEPMVRNPTDIDIDERGRVWVAEGVNYRSSFQKWGILQPAGDRIVIPDHGDTYCSRVQTRSHFAGASPCARRLGASPPRMRHCS